MLETLRGFSIIEWIGLITGIIYIILSAQNRISCWYFGIISCACIAYHDFFGGLKLYSDGVLQLFYMVIGVVGLVKWREVSVSFNTSFKTHLWVSGVGILAAIFYGYVMGQFSDAYFPMIDAFTTVFGIIATVFLVNRNLSAWLYFIAIDITMSYLYFVRGYELYAVLYTIFTIVAMYAAWNWWRLFRLNLNS